LSLISYRFDLSFCLGHMCYCLPLGQSHWLFSRNKFEGCAKSGILNREDAAQVKQTVKHTNRHGLLLSAVTHTLH
jgi:hypothetical protein